MDLEIEELLQLLHGIFGLSNRMTYGPRVFVDFVVISTLVGFVAKKVDLGKHALFLDVLQTVGLVPTSRKDIERDLTSNTVGQAVVGKLLTEDSDELLAQVMDFVISLEVVSFLDRSITSNGRDIDHAIAELNKGSSLDWNIHIGNVMQNEACQFFVLVFANPFDKAVGRERLAQAVRGQSILREAIIEHINDVYSINTHLFLLLHHVTTADVSDGNLFAQLLQQLNHFRAYQSTGWCEGVVNIEETDCPFNRTLS